MLVLVHHAWLLVICNTRLLLVLHSGTGRSSHVGTPICNLLRRKVSGCVHGSCWGGEAIIVVVFDMMMLGMGHGVIGWGNRFAANTAEDGREAQENEAENATYNNSNNRRGLALRFRPANRINGALVRTRWHRDHRVVSGRVQSPGHTGVGDTVAVVRVVAIAVIMVRIRGLDGLGHACQNSKDAR